MSTAAAAEPGPVRGAGRGGGLLAVHAHPDDETLSTGALLATWAAAGLPVTVVTCTRGERGEVIPAELAHLEGDGEALAAHRTVELRAALDALGVGDHVFLDDAAGGPRWVDSGMAWGADGHATVASDVSDDAFALVDVERAAAALARVMADRRPAVVVGYEPHGGYGHPDHVQAHRVMTRAVERLSVSEAGVRPCVLWAALDADALVAGRAALSVTAGPGLRPGSTLPWAAAAPAELDVEVDVAPVLDRVLAAMRAHATQVQAVAPVRGGGLLAQYALSNDLLEPVPDREVYRAAPGSDPAAVRWPTGVRVR